MAFDFTENTTIELPYGSGSDIFSEAVETKNHGLIIEMAAIHSGLTANYNLYTAEALEEALDSWVTPYPKPLIVNHDLNTTPIGRVMAAKMDKESDGTPFTRLQIAVLDPEAIRRVVDGRYLTGSVGGKATEAVCTICSANWANASAFSAPCKHSRGKVYKGGVAALEMRGLGFKEMSFVNLPADARSGVRSSGFGSADEATQDLDDSWVRSRPARIFALNMEKEEIFEYCESEQRNILTTLRKKESRPLYLGLKGAFLSTMAVNEELLEEKDGGKEPYGDVEYADPGFQKDGKKRYPIDTPDHVRAAWDYINKGSNAAKYSPEQLAHIKGKIRAAAKRHGVEIGGKEAMDDDVLLAAEGLSADLAEAAAGHAHLHWHEDGAHSHGHTHEAAAGAYNTSSYGVYNHGDGEPHSHVHVDADPPRDINFKPADAYTASDDDELVSEEEAADELIADELASDEEAADDDEAPADDEEPEDDAAAEEPSEESEAAEMDIEEAAAAHIHMHSHENGTHTHIHTHSGHLEESEAEAGSQLAHADFVFNHGYGEPHSHNHVAGDPMVEAHKSEWISGGSDNDGDGDESDEMTAHAASEEEVVEESEVEVEEAAAAHSHKHMHHDGEHVHVHHHENGNYSHGDVYDVHGVYGLGEQGPPHAHRHDESAPEREMPDATLYSSDVRGLRYAAESEYDRNDDRLHRKVHTKPAEGQERPLRRDVDPYTGDGAPFTRSETELNESATESHVEELEQQVEALTQENTRLRAALKRGLAERVVDTKIAMGLLERADRDVELTEHVGRSAASLADTLRDLSTLTVADSRPDYSQIPKVQEHGSAITLEEDKNEQILDVEEVTTTTQTVEEKAIDLFTDVLMGRRNL